MSKKIAIIGAGGHGKVIGEIALLNEYEIIHFFDDQVSKIKEFPFKLIDNVDYLEKCLKDYSDFFVAIGNNQTRSKMIDWLRSRKMNIVNLAHPSATISKLSSLGKGNCIMANAVINAGTLIKDGVIINTSASIDHDCLIADFCHISPNCSISGGVRIGKFSHLGTGTSVHPGINIGKNVKSGIGSKIFKNILDNSILKN